MMVQRDMAKTTCEMCECRMALSCLLRASFSRFLIVICASCPERAIMLINLRTVQVSWWWTLRSKVISLAFDVSLAAVIKKAKTSDTRADKRDEISQKGMAAVTVKTRMNFRMIELEDDCRMAPLVGEVIPKYLAYLVIQMSHFGKWLWCIGNQKTYDVASMKSEECRQPTTQGMTKGSGNDIRRKKNWFEVSSSVRTGADSGRC